MEDSPAGAPILRPPASSLAPSAQQRPAAGDHDEPATGHLDPPRRACGARDQRNGSLRPDASSISPSAQHRTGAGDDDEHAAGHLDPPRRACGVRGGRNGSLRSDACSNRLTSLNSGSSSPPANCTTPHPPAACSVSSPMDTPRKRRSAHVEDPHSGCHISGQQHAQPSCISPSHSPTTSWRPRQVRRRLDMPCPGSFIATEGRRRRLATTFPGTQNENSAPLLCNGHRLSVLMLMDSFKSAYQKCTWPF